MRVILVTQEEPFYIPTLVAEVLQRFREVVAVVLLPGTLHGLTRLPHLKRLLEVFGIKASLAFGALFIYYRFLNVLGRLFKLSRFYSVRSAARGSSVPVYVTDDVNGWDFLQSLRAMEPDVIASIAAPQIFKKELIELPRRGTMNIHASLLPRYRGMMPRFWVLAKGEEETGVTAHFVDSGIDTGDIILQHIIEISPEETLHSLQKKIARVGAVVLLEALERIEKGQITGTPMAGEGSYYSFPTRDAAKEFRRRGRRFI